MRPKLLGGALVATLALIAAPAFAAPVNLVQNGSFELGNYVPNQFTICECSIKPNTPQASAIANWTVVAPPGALPDSGIDWLQNFPDAAIPQPSDGVKNIDLSGDDPGAIQQSVATTAGVSYTVTFDVGSNEDPSVPSTAAHTLEVLAGPADQTFTIPRTTVGYLHDQLIFTATSSSSLLEFIDTDTPATSEGPVLDNVALFATPLTRTATTEDSCENGGFSSEANASGTVFSSQAACDAFVTGTTLSATLSNGQCNNITFTGDYHGDVTVPQGATCVLAPGAVVEHDLNVQKGATLYDEGATVQHDFQAQQANGVDIDPGSQVGHDLNINGLTGVPATETANEICGANIGHDMTIQNSAAGAPVEAGCADEGGNSVGHDINVNNNAGPVTVDDNTSGHDLNVNNNTGGATVMSDTSGHDINTNNNKPGALIAGGNSASHNDNCQGNAAGSNCNAPVGGGGGGLSLAHHTSTSQLIGGSAHHGQKAHRVRRTRHLKSR